MRPGDMVIAESMPGQGRPPTSGNWLLWRTRGGEADGDEVGSLRQDDVAVVVSQQQSIHSYQAGRTMLLVLSPRGELGWTYERYVRAP